MKRVVTITPGATGPKRAPCARRVGVGVLAAALLALTPAGASVAAAQDFLFSRPHGSFGLRGGWNMARADSQIFDELTTDLTLGRRDLQSLSGGAELAVSLTRRLDIVGGVLYTSTRARSEYRDWEEERESGEIVPIEQSTRFERIPLTAGLKYYVTPRGTSIGRFAWVPSRVAFFVGGGGGMMRYRFVQSGDFVYDCDDFGCGIDGDVTLSSDGWAATVHALGGADVSLGRRTFVTLEARQAWASADLDEAYFRGYDSIDLSGLQLSLGVSWRF